jgi:hypothetical protein
MTTPTPTRVIFARVPVNLYTRLTRRAKKWGGNGRKSVNQVAVAAMEEWCERQEEAEMRISRPVEMALYSIGTWDIDLQAYTPQDGLSVPSFNITLPQLRQAVRELRRMGYTAHRKRSEEGDYDENDWSVLIERTDGKEAEEILKSWER